MILEALLVTVLFCFSYWYTRSAKYRIGDFPSPPAYFLLGHAPYINSTDRLLPFFGKCLTEYNGIVKILLGSEVVLSATNLKFVEWIMTSTTMITKSMQYAYFSEWLGNGILLASGAHWKLHRKILTPAFHFKRVENHIGVSQKAVNILIQQMAKKQDEEYLNVYPLISDYSLDVVCESSMATSINAQEDKSGFRKSINFLCKIIIERVFHVFYMNNWIFQFHPQYGTYKEAIENIHNFDQSMIVKRRKLLEDSYKASEVDEAENMYGEKKRTPFLDILLTAKDDNGLPLSDKDIRDQVDVIMFAGHETTASAISFILYNLSIHPDVQEKVFNEQKEINVKKSSSEMTSSDLNDMKYLEKVIKESLRMYPPISFIGRRLEEDTYYDGKLIPKNTTLMIVLHHLHRNPDVFPDPEKFDPSRFDNDSKIPNFAYLPFSAGLRNCIGQKFAMFGIKVAISELIKNFEFLPAENYKPELVTEVSLKASNGICVKLKKRKS